MGSQKRKRGPGRPAAGRRALSPQQIADAALRMIDAEGIDALSMRRLGQALGVEAMALYNHFADKDAILDAVANLVLASVPVPAAKGGWKSRMRAVCSAVRHVAQQHPSLFRLALTRPLPPAAALPLIESAMSAVSNLGLTVEDQTCAYHTCLLYVRSFCLWEIEELSRKPTGVELATIAAGYRGAGTAMKVMYDTDVDGSSRKASRRFCGGLRDEFSAYRGFGSSPRDRWPMHQSFVIACFSVRGVLVRFNKPGAKMEGPLRHCKSSTAAPRESASAQGRCTMVRARYAACR